MFDPTPYIALVDAMNAFEKDATRGINHTTVDLDAYTATWDSVADRWTLVSETDEAPELCSYNQNRNECSELDLCEQCHQAAGEYADALDMRAAYDGS